MKITNSSSSILLFATLTISFDHGVLGEKQGLVELFSRRSTLAVTEEATYSCVFTNMWNSIRHPIQYPSNTAHWSAPVLAAHSANYSMWEVGGMASPGVEETAETGSNDMLIDEITMPMASMSTGDLAVGQRTFNDRQTNQMLPDITVSADHPYLSSISMIAPSPDWFSGFYNYDMRAASGRSWKSEIVLLTYPFDAGTEQGTTYGINNDPESPHVPISQLTNVTVPANGVLLNPAGDDVLPVLKWECVLENFTATAPDAEPSFQVPGDRLIDP